MRTYSVRVTHEGKWWLARATDFDSAVTQARHLSQVEAAAKDMIAALEDVDADDVQVVMALDVVGDVDLAFPNAEVLDRRRTVEQAQAEYGDLLRHEARRMAKNGLTVRDIGAYLSVSHQRVQQLLAASSGVR